MSGRDATTCAGGLTALLRDILGETRQLESALDAERSALEAQNTVALDESSAMKRTSLSRLEALDAERRQRLAAHDYPPDDRGMEALLAECAPGHALHGIWSDLRAVAVRCRDANATNGAIVQLRRQQIARALDVLRGAPATPSHVYGADGRRIPAGGRVVGSA